MKKNISRLTVYVLSKGFQRKKYLEILSVSFQNKYLDSIILFWKELCKTNFWKRFHYIKIISGNLFITSNRHCILGLIIKTLKG